MFIMKKLMLFMIGSAVFATTAVAQNADQPAKTEQTAKKEAADGEKKVKDDLKLTDEQTVKYDAINREYKEKMDAVMNDAAITKEAQKEKKMALKKKNKPN
jgi:ribulose kinase